MGLLLQLLTQGIALGLVYGLIALGFVIVFKGSKTFNFAHGDFVMGGAYLVIAAASVLPYALAAAVAVGGMVVIALLVESLILRRMVGTSLTTVVLATLGLSIMMRSLVVMIWGVDQQGSADPIGRGTVEIGEVVLPWSALATIAVSGIVLGLLAYFYRRTPFGLALRATASHQEAALAQGIDVRRMFALSWGIAAVLAVIAGIFLGAFPRQVSPGMGMIALAALPAIVIGGFDSFLGAIVGGLVVGLVQVLGAGYLSDLGGGKLHEVLPYIVMFLVLIVRPYGLFGSREVERV